MNTVIHFIRKRDEELRQWSVSKEPRILFLSGAPRVGKSHLASWMGKNLFNDDFMSVDCADRKHSEQIIGISSNLGGVTAAVAQRYGRKVVPSKTLLFF